MILTVNIILFSLLFCYLNDFLRCGWGIEMVVVLTGEVCSPSARISLDLAQGKSLALYVYDPGIPDSVYKHINRILCIAL